MLNIDCQSCAFQSAAAFVFTLIHDVYSAHATLLTLVQTWLSCKVIRHNNGQGRITAFCFASFRAVLPLRSELQDTVADLRAQLQSQAGQLQSHAGQLESAAALEGVLTEQQREMDRLHSQLVEQQQASNGLQREATLAHIQLEESREAFRVRIQHCMLEVCLQPLVKFPHTQHSAVSLHAH